MQARPPADAVLTGFLRGGLAIFIVDRGGGFDANLRVDVFLAPRVTWTGGKELERDECRFFWRGWGGYECRFFSNQYHDHAIFCPDYPTYKSRLSDTFGVYFTLGFFLRAVLRHFTFNGGVI